MLYNQYYLFYPETGEKFTLDKYEAYNLLTKYNLKFCIYYQHEYDIHENYFLNIVYAIENVDYCIIVIYDNTDSLFDYFLSFPSIHGLFSFKIWNSYYKNLLLNHKCEKYLEYYDTQKDSNIYECEVCKKHYWENKKEDTLIEIDY